MGGVPKYRRIPKCEGETSRDKSQSVASLERLFKTRDLELPFLERSLPSLVIRIAATSTRKSLATAIATQKITATPKTPP